MVDVLRKLCSTAFLISNNVYKHSLVNLLLNLNIINLALLPTQISERISQKLFNKISNPYINLDNEYFNLLYIKAALISENLNFLEKNSFKGGLVRYGFYT